MYCEDMIERIKDVMILWGTNIVLAVANVVGIWFFGVFCVQRVWDTGEYNLAVLPATLAAVWGGSLTCFLVAQFAGERFDKFCEHVDGV